ncbi:hypothetical protein THAOC_03035 [Thalassiosira oceanica]|uniref:Uncharacterized protein n=1 Tax=Thalassiosira oceanica TaxID=159749 RepID=K0TQ14_THAOC|nr:hypothetical protein THAOC_03035 [Thalassiosira oceanica]|eukprot:EJK75252.1 hypothetical protein THAOC_03035 [Thalassiosira oceanica]
MYDLLAEEREQFKDEFDRINSLITNRNDIDDIGQLQSTMPTLLGGVKSFLFGVTESDGCGLGPFDPKVVPYGVGTIVDGINMLGRIVSYPSDTTVSCLDTTLSAVQGCIENSSRVGNWKERALSLIREARHIDHWLEKTKDLIELLDGELIVECHRFVEDARCREVFLVVA